MDCGADPKEIDEALAGRHTFAEYKIFGDLSLVLCNFCQVDFSSYDPTFFGLPLGERLGMGSGRGWDFIRDVQPFIAKDKYCSHCGHRLSFLRFVAQARRQHADQYRLDV